VREIRTLRRDAAGAGNVAWPRSCDTRRRKGETTVNTNFGLNRRASPRPYQRSMDREDRLFRRREAVMEWVLKA